MNFDQARAALDRIGQAHVLQFWDTIDESSRRRLLDQIAALDLELIAQLSESHVRSKPPVAIPSDIQPVTALPRNPDPPRKDLYRQAVETGKSLLRQGRVAAFLVAGGQGTRLGYSGPKGEFPVTPIRKKSLFQLFAEQLRAHARDANHAIPWFIMTSAENDAATRAFFDRNNYFNLARTDVFFFQQGLMPAFSFDGKILLSDNSSLALGPDGHGGSLSALRRSGALDQMRARNIEHLSYFQVDNPLVHCIDPLFLGLHAMSNSEMSSKTIAKANPQEKVGMFVSAPLAAGSPHVVQIIEYTDLPESLARQTLPDGSLRFNAGSIAIHALSVKFIDRLTADGRLRLPWHRAEKKFPCIDSAGNRHDPKEPNAVKLEQFVFDAIPLAANALVYATDRAEEFSPVKNAEGPDSPATALRDQIARAALWLAEVGIRVPMRDGAPDATIEISPLFATSAQKLAAHKPSIRAVIPRQSLYLQ
jgi:UDP-N-acetylglucosamine/UDP-N-acetylgalactosamine diphosphorylase